MSVRALHSSHFRQIMFRNGRGDRSAGHTNDRVHHLNYFVQPETVRALRLALEIKTAA